MPQLRWEYKKVDDVPREGAMRQIDDLGLFWLPGEDDNAISARLTFDPASSDGIKLSIVGRRENSPLLRGGSHPRIHGIVKKDLITLDDCIPGKSSSNSSGVDYHSYRPNRMFIGHHLTDSSDRMRFDSVTVELGGLPSWIRFKDMVEVWNHEEKSAAPLYQLQFTPSSEQSASFSRGELSVVSLWETEGRGGDDGRAGMRQWPAIKLAYSDLQPFRDIETDIRHVHDLVTLCMDTYVAVDRVSLRNSSVRARNIGGGEFDFPQAIEYVTQPIRYTSPEERKVINEHRMFLTFAGAGGVSTLAGWIDVAPRFHRALMSMMSVQHARHMYMENRFLNVAFAAEAFHRELYDESHMEPAEHAALLKSYLDKTPPEHHEWLDGKLSFANSPPFRKRLIKLARSSRPSISEVIHNLDNWARIVTSVRNDLTHLKSGAEQFRGRDLYFLSESIYTVVRYCMLLEAGVAPETLGEGLKRYSIRWYADRLKTALDDAAAVIKRNDERRSDLTLQ